MIIDDYIDKIQEGCDFKLTGSELKFVRLVLISYGNEVIYNKDCLRECKKLYDEELSNIIKPEIF